MPSWGRGQNFGGNLEDKAVVLRKIARLLRRGLSGYRVLLRTQDHFFLKLQTILHSHLEGTLLLSNFDQNENPAAPQNVKLQVWRKGRLGLGKTYMWICEWD